MSHMELGIPDGEYELELSDVLQNQLGVSQDHKDGSSGRVRPIQRVNDEILSIRCEWTPHVQRYYSANTKQTGLDQTL